MDLNHSHHEKPLLFLIVIAICLVGAIFYLSSSYNQQSKADWPSGLSYNPEYHPSTTGIFGRGVSAPSFDEYRGGITGLPNNQYAQPSNDAWSNLINSFNLYTYNPNYTTIIPTDSRSFMSGFGNNSSGGGLEMHSFGDCEAYNLNGVVACRIRGSNPVKSCGPPMGRGQCYERFSSCEAIPASKCPLEAYPSSNNTVYLEGGKKCAIYSGKCSEPREDLDKACAKNKTESSCRGDCFWQGNSAIDGKCISNNGDIVRSCINLDRESCNGPGKEYCEAKDAYCGTNGNEGYCFDFFVDGWTDKDYCYINSQGACISSKDDNDFNISCGPNPSTTIEKCSANAKDENSCNSGRSFENGCQWKNEFKCVPKKTITTK